MTDARQKPLGSTESVKFDVRWAVRWVEEDGEKDFWKRCALSLEWKRVGVMDGVSGDDGAGRVR